MSKKSKKDMLEEMIECGWNPSFDENDSWEDVKSEYEVFLDETSGDSSMFPNGRDYDAEDEDGI